MPSRRSRAQLAHLRYADLGPSRPSDLTERSLTLASACRYVTPVSRRFRQAQWIVPSLFSSPHSPLRSALVGRQDCVPASSDKSQSSQRHQDGQPVFVVMFRRQIAHVAVSADLLQRKPPRLYGFLSPEPLHVQVPPIRLCMPRFAELSVSTSSFGSIPASTNSWTHCNPPAAARPVAHSSSARESNDVLCRAAEFNGMQSILFKCSCRAPT